MNGSRLRFSYLMITFANVLKFHARYKGEGRCLLRIRQSAPCDMCNSKSSLVTVW